MNKRKLKLCMLAVCKACGLFALVRRGTRSQLRILCYHGFSVGEESRWSGGIMMSPEVLRRRLALLRTGGYPVLPLDDAVKRLKQGTLPANSVAITIDDGFQTTYTVAHDIFQEFSFPYTVYVTTYYSDKDIPIINLILSFALWKTKRKEINTNFMMRDEIFDISSDKGKKNLFEFAFATIDTIKNIDVKKEMLAKLLENLDLDVSDILSRNTLKVLTSEQIRALSNDGVAIEMHTHRHRFPEDRQLLHSELATNQNRLHAITGKTPTHLCYPSGEYYVSALPFLEEFGIASATLAEEGLNNSATNPLLLKRFLDAETLADLEFEAYLSGFTPSIKRICGL